MIDGGSKPRVAIVGTVGLPAAYSGFETLAEHLVRYNERQGLPLALTVYCSARHFQERPATYHGAKLHYVNLDANNASSLVYDAVTMLSAIRQGVDTILLLGVSGAWALPLIRLFSNARIVTNIDGIEWRREKWRGVAKWVLRASERIAARWSHKIIADNGAIVDYIRQAYGRESVMIAYGGDHALEAAPRPFSGLPARYSLALCRIEPENNVRMILEAFADDPTMPLVFIGNWDRSPFGRDLKQRFGSCEHIRIVDPVYDVATLRSIREGSALYVHGHSAGGTNPSLVEMMHFGKPIIAYDCVFNRQSTEDEAFYFSSSAELKRLVQAADLDSYTHQGARMITIARERYTWDKIGAEYTQQLSYCR
jgi:glycosyltransferase involved in cell wall biosynthesis